MSNAGATRVGNGFQTHGACSGGKGASVPVPRPGDWHCPNSSCKNHSGNIVFGNKVTCPICGTDKPEHPIEPRLQPPQQYGQMPGGCGRMPMTMQQQKGRPGDWHCPNESCKNHRENVVYGSKSSCPICGMAKPEDDSAAVSAPVFPPAYASPPSQQPQMMCGMGAGKGGSFG